MSQVGSQPSSAIILPYVSKFIVGKAPLDDWGYYEGLPTPAKSPLMPYNTVPWWYRPWMYDKLISPKYSFAQVEAQPETISDIQTFNIISKSIINKPSFITDYHMIAIRKQIEQLFAPFFRAHVNVFIKDTMHYPPCFQLTHSQFQVSWWAEPGSGDNIGSFQSGHNHTFRDQGPSGSLRLRQTLTIADNSGDGTRDGSVRGIFGTEANFRTSYGNYYILSISPRWSVTEYWRKAFLESPGDIFEDYESTATSFQHIVWGPWKDILRANSGFSPVGYAKMFSIDYGGMWEAASSITYTGEENDGIPQAQLVLQFDEDTGQWDFPVGPIYSSCTRPAREFGNTFMSGSNRVAALVTKAAIGFNGFADIWGFKVGIFGGPIDNREPDPTPGFPSIITRQGQVIYDYNARMNQSPPGFVFSSGSGFFNLTYDIATESGELTITPSEQTMNVTGGTYYAHCLGALARPYFRVEIMDLNGMRYTIDVNDVETYFL